MGVVFKIFSESFLSAIKELWTNKLRAFLTLLGISIGIFCVISVLSAFDSMETNLKTSIDKLGSNVIYINKMPWIFDKEYPWWKYINRPHATYDEMKILEQKVPDAEAVAIILNVPNKIIKYSDRSIDNANVMGVSQHYDEFQPLDFQNGRFFSAQESAGGEPVVMIGSSVSDELFPENDNPIGKQIVVMGSKVSIVGVFAKEGESILNNSKDNLVMVPYNYLSTKVNTNDYRMEPFIMVKGKAKIGLSDLKDELRPVMRNIRHENPKQEDNFALNQMSVLTDLISSIFGILDIVGILIGGFAILVGGFGIANIMFVSVKERTNLIGIKKALGAKSYFILLEFLIESVVLSVIGGLLGLALVYFITLIVNHVFDFSILLSINNIVIGIGISALIGVVSGILPALSAARLNPVDAIRFK